MPKLPLDAKISLIQKMAEDLSFYSEIGVCPSEQEFTITSSDEDSSVEMIARIAAFEDISMPLTKLSFDTRRIDQNKDRNPRRNLQNWHRSESFIDDETADKLEVMAKVDSVIKSLQGVLQNEPEWFDSYARQLSANIDRLNFKRVGDTTVDIHKPHLSYLEQLIYNRYRLTLDNIKNASEEDLKTAFISKDESLNAKYKYIVGTGSIDGIKKIAPVFSEPLQNVPAPKSAIMTVPVATAADEQVFVKVPTPSNDDKVLQLLEQAIGRNAASDDMQVIKKQQAETEKALKLLQSTLDAQGYKGAVVEAPAQSTAPASDGSVFSSIFGNGSIRRAGEKAVERTITIKIVDSSLE